MPLEYSSEEYRWSDEVIVYQTDGEGGEDPDIDGTEKFTENIDLTRFTSGDLDFHFTGSDGTDDLVFNLYQRNDSGWEDIELTWKAQFTITNPGTKKIFHYTIPRIYGPGHYRFGLLRSGSTTTFDLKVTLRTSRLWNVVREEDE